MRTCRNTRFVTTRRDFLRDTAAGFGWLALAALNAEQARADAGAPRGPLAPKGPHFPARAKRVIFLHMAGAPSQLDLFDYKPDLAKLHGQECPASFLEGKRFAFITGVPRMLGPQYPFHQAGKSGSAQNKNEKVKTHDCGLLSV